jgi:hypothetical protein
MHPDDDVDRLFAELVAYVREEISILEQISRESVPGAPSFDDAAFDADKLEKLLDQALAATSAPDAAARVEPSRSWGMRFSSIHRIVENDYSDSSHAAAKKAVEEKIYRVAVVLAESDRP